MIEIKFKNLNEYLDAIYSLNKKFNCNANDIWYRGVRSDNMKLLPGVAWRGMNEGSEATIIADFLTYFGNYTSLRPKTPLELYVLMQHYGLPTRLLDWSLSPLIALYFALEGESDGSSRVVWAMHPHFLNEKSIGEEMIIAPNDFSKSSIENYVPKYLRDNDDEDVPLDPVAIALPFTNQRITSQKGAFTIHGYGQESIDEYCERLGVNAVIKITLDNEKLRDKILKNLYLIGIKEDDVYQDLGSLARRLIREYRL